MAVHPTELRARDLVRSKDVAVRHPPGRRTLDRVWDRAWRRPVGSSERLWQKVGWEDPFARPAEHAKPEYRNVYVAGRFVRLDKSGAPQSKLDAEIKRAQTQPKAPNQPKAQEQAPASGKGAQDASPGSWKGKVSALQAAADAKKAERGKMTNTPAAGKAAQSPMFPPKVKGAKAAPPPEVDRTPPIIAQGPPGTSPSGRIRAAPSAVSRKPPITEGDTPVFGRAPEQPEGFFSRASAAKAPEPPKHAPKATAAPAPAPKPASPPPAAPPAALPPAAAPPPVAASPPPAASVATAAAAREPAAAKALAVPIKLPPGAINTPGAPEVVPLRKPTRVVEEPPPEPAGSKPAATVNRAPPIAGGMDDVFGMAAQEGRVRISRVKKDPA